MALSKRIFTSEDSRGYIIVLELVSGWSSLQDKCLEEEPGQAVDWILYLPLATIIATVCLLGAFPGGDASWGKSLCPTGQFPEHLDEAACGVFSPYDTLHVTSLLAALQQG